MKKRILYIIGNGFDIYHGIQSRYSDFGAYVQRQAPDLYSVIEQYFDSVNFWSDLEQELASFDVDALMDDASEFLVSYAADDWSDAYHHDYQYEINEVVHKVSVTLKAKFANWLYQLNIPDPFNARGKLNYLNPDAHYLSFNYTNTLNSVYSIPNSNVLFIHGQSTHEDSDLILGHAWSPSERMPLHRPYDTEEDYQEHQDYYEEDVRIMQGNQIIDNYFRQTYKPTREIIKQHQSFFNGLQDIETVYVLGHSMSEVDMEYFKEIVQNLDDRTVRWKVSYYGDSELGRHKGTMEILGISEKLVEFHELPNMPTV
jgi:hypothetical protein